jgi:hypothetical protein
MSQPAFITPDGRFVNTDTLAPPATEEHQEDPLHVVAAREAAKQSTKVCTTK